MNKPHDSPSAECRLVVVDSQSLRILTIADTGRPRLPRMRLSPFARGAETLTQAIEQKFGLCTIQLTLRSGSNGLGCCAVHEIVGSTRSKDGSLSFAPLDQIFPGELEDKEQDMVLRVLSRKANELGRFALLGWIDTLLTKLDATQDRSSKPIIRQLNQGTDFCLLSLTYAGGRKLWFKAVGEPNTHEYTLTRELARRFPTYLPKILATIPEWNAWVMEDVEGVPLNESADVHVCEGALTALAVMQKEVAADAASLSALGAKDWKFSRIAALSKAFFLEAKRAMQAQTSSNATPLSNSDLFRLKCDIDVALEEFMYSNIPDTLLHCDIGHGNIIATSRGPVFLDWAETAIGHPYLTAEHLLADFTRLNNVSTKRQSALRRSYSTHWKGYLESRKLDTVTALAPSVAAFVYALMAWDANRNRPDPTRAWPLIRSMLRRTRNELDRIPEFIT